MTTRPESAFWSGLLILAGLVVLILGATWLQSFLKWRSGHWFVVEFRKVMGLEPGSEVMLQGMRVGTVDRIELKPPNTVQVIVRLEKNVPVYYPPASQITIRFGTLIGQPYVDIVNLKAGKVVPEGGVVEGIDPISWEELVPEAKELSGSLKMDIRRTTESLRRLSDRLNQLVSDKRFDAIVGNVELATRQLAAILSDPELKKGISGSVREAELTLRSARKILGNKEMQRNLETFVANLRESSEELKTLLSEKGVGGELKKVLFEAKEIIASAREVISDPEVKSALKTTARNLAELTGRGHDVLSELEASMKQLREFIENTQGDLKKVAEHLRGITQDLDETLDAVKWLVTEGGLKENLKQIGENLKVTSENLKEATNVFRELITSEEAKTSLKEGLKEVGPTVLSVRQTAERGQKILQRLEMATDLKTRAGSSVWFVPKLDETKGEIWTTLETPISPISLLAGTHAGKGGARLNLQIQGKIGSNFLWRFGAFRSKLGAGIGWDAERLRLDIEAFNPDSLQFNSWLRMQLSPSTFLRLGFEDLGRNPTLGVGLEFGRR